MNHQFLEATPHGELREIFPHVFFVMGSFELQAQGMEGVQFSRNMIVLREGSDLTLINSVRLTEEGLKTLDTLGHVKHIVKIGSHHNADDAFYVDRYNPKVLGLQGMEATSKVAIDEFVDNGSSLPVAGASVFVFDTSKTAEGLVFLDREGGILISCDALHNWVEVDEFFNEKGAAKMKEWGFLKPANVGPGWINNSNPQPEEFQRLLELDFKHALCGHGASLLETAHSAYRKTFQELGLVS